MMKKQLMIVPALMTALALAACNDGQKQQAQTALQIINSDGSGWIQVKSDSDVDGYAVFQKPDGSFAAIDVTGITVGMTKDQLMSRSPVYDNLIHGVETGSKVYSPSGAVGTTDEDVYTDANSGMVFEVGDTSSKDLAAVSGAIQALSTSQVRNLLVMSYGLSEDRAQELASLAQSWNDVSKSRTMTAKDLVEFQSKAFGSDLGTLSAAADKAAQGDSAQYNSLMQKAAAMNNISPEQANSIIQGFIN